MALSQVKALLQLEQAAAAKKASSKSWMSTFMQKIYSLCAEPLIMGLFSGIGYHGSKLVYELVYSRIMPPSPSPRYVPARQPCARGAKHVRASRHPITHVLTHSHSLSLSLSLFLFLSYSSHRQDRKQRQRGRAAPHPGVSCPLT